MRLSVPGAMTPGRAPSAFLHALALLVIAPAAPGCRDEELPALEAPDPPATDLGEEDPTLDVQTLHFRSDPPIAPGEETLTCHVVNVPGLEGSYVRALAWSPAEGPVAVHHLTMSVAPPDTPVGTYPCGITPATGVMFIFALGSERLTLPPGVGLRLPYGTTRVYLEAHVLRSAAGQGARTYVDLGLSHTKPAHEAAWLDVPGKVEPILPHTSGEATGSCRFDADVRLIGTWPHMHRLGRSFAGTVRRASGGEESLVTVDPWDFDHQPMYLRDVSLSAGDAILTRCTYQNDGDAAVEGGPFSSDEMCNQGLWVWPSEAAHCAP
jgi:hypothetical protein